MIIWSAFSKAFYKVIACRDLETQEIVDYLAVDSCRIASHILSLHIHSEDRNQKCLNIQILQKNLSAYLMGIGSDGS